MALLLAFVPRVLAQEHLATPSLHNLQTPVNHHAQDTECARQARISLGEDAVVLKCGFLNTPGVLETVAALKKEPVQPDDGMIVSKLVIRRHDSAGWYTALTVSKWIQNPMGYIGIDFIDDTAPFWGYSVQFDDHRADGRPAFVLSVSYMATPHDNGEVPVDISWNPAVGRYQEFSMNTPPFGFKREIKNPPHQK